MYFRKFAGAALVVAGILLLAGCEAMFTYTPLAAFQRPPSSLGPEARLTWAQDALASGDAAAMKTAYDAIKNDPGAEAEYTAAQLGIELSGVPSLLLEVVSDPSGITADLNNIDGFITAHNLDPSYLVAAAAKLQAADPDVELTATDYALGALGLLLGSAQTINGNWDITDPAVNTAPAIAFFSAAVGSVASLSPSDPLRTFVERFQTDFLDLLP